MDVASGATGPTSFAARRFHFIILVADLRGGRETCCQRRRGTFAYGAGVFSGITQSIYRIWEVGRADLTFRLVSIFSLQRYNRAT
jgi:hypothetical protein